MNPMGLKYKKGYPFKKKTKHAKAYGNNLMVSYFYSTLTIAKYILDLF